MNSSSSERDPVERLADEFLERYRRGERPALTEYTDKYPQWAERIRKVFPALILMEGIRPATGETTGAGSGDLGVLEDQRLERLGDYRILREVGRGGMGIVYEAEQESLGRHVALKVLPSQALLDSRHVQRFQREAKAAARLHHTNIVPVYGVGEDAGLHYYVMQFIQGLGLDEVLAEVNRLRQAKQSPGEKDRGATPSGRGQAVSVAVVAHGLLTGHFEAGPSEPVPPAPSALTPLPSLEGNEAEISARLPRESSGVTSDSAVHLPGQSAGSTLSESGRPYWQSVARVGIQVAEALAYAHSQGVLHRDIKPSNLLLDTHGTVWITDFGLAKVAGSEDLTHSGDIVGTVRYLAPERFEGKADARSDLYALGLTLYELLTLRSAFDETDRNKLIAQVMHAEPARPRQIEPEVPRDLETIVLKALERDPERRYQTADELADDLKRFVAGEPIRARRVSPWQRLVLWAKRRPAVAALVAVSGVAALALVAVVVGGLYHWQLRQANDRTETALQAEAEARQLADQARQAEEKQKQRAETALYFNRIVLAEREWWANNVGRTRQLLEDCPTALRGWEWQYLQRLCHSELLTFSTGHTRSGTAFSDLAISPDGKRLASAGPDKTVKIWDPMTGQEIGTFSGSTLPVGGLAFSSDGKLLASGNSLEPLIDASGNLLKVQPSEVIIWDATTYQPLRTLPGPTPCAQSLAFSPDSQYLAVVNGGYARAGEAEVQVWETATGKKRWSLHGHIGWVIQVAFSPDGKHLASAGFPSTRAAAQREPGEIKVWDLTSGQPILSPRGHTAGVQSVAFSPDGQWLASASHDQTVRIWDAATGQERHTLRGHTDSVWRVVFSPDGRLASASDDGSVKIWDATTGLELFALRGHTGAVHGLVFHPGGERLISASPDGTIKVWDATTVQEHLTLRGHTGSVRQVAFSHDGKHLASSGGGDVNVWDTTSGQKILTLPRNHGARFSPDGLYLATAAGTGSLKVWDAVTGHEIQTLPGHRNYVTTVVFSPDGQRLASGSWDKTARIWNITTGQELRTLTGHTNRVHSVAFSPDGLRLATASNDKTARIWDVTTGRELLTLHGHPYSVYEAVFSPDGLYVATASDDGTGKVWDAMTGQVILTLRGHVGPVSGVAFSADGQRIATAGYDRAVKIWDAATGQEALTLRGHTNEVWSVAFSPDGQRLAASGEDRSVRVWETIPLTPELRQQRKVARLQSEAALLQSEAALLVNGLTTELLIKEDVRQRLRQDPTLPDPVRQQALTLLERYREDHRQFASTIWRVIPRPGAEPAKYQRALRQAEVLCRMDVPEMQHYFLFTLGTAQYRGGNYQDAVETLKRADTLYSARAKGLLPVLDASTVGIVISPLGQGPILAAYALISGRAVHRDGAKHGYVSTLPFLAMAHHQLRQKEQAEAVMTRLRETMKLPGYAQNTSIRSYLRETEALLQQPNKPADP